MDSANYVTLMLMDKGYYDYDYSEPKRKATQDVAPKSQADTQKMVARFGIGTAKPKPSMEDLQRMAMESVGENLETTENVPHGT